MSSRKRQQIDPRERHKLSTMANAIRECLGLEPLYKDGSGSRERSDLERFYVAPIAPGHVSGRRRHRGGGP